MHSSRCSYSKMASRLMEIRRLLRKLNIFAAVEDFCYKLANALSYLPLLYKWDYRWDASTCMLRIMKFKLQRTEKCMRNGYHAFKPTVFKKMKTINLLIDRILDDNYHDNVFKYHNEKYGELDVKFEDIPKGATSGRILITRPNANTPELKTQERKEFRKLMHLTTVYRKQDIALLFKLYSRGFDSWAD